MSAPTHSKTTAPMAAPQRHLSYPRFLWYALRAATDGSLAFYAWMTLLTAIMLVGANTWAHQVAGGLHITGMGDHVSWGLYIANFTFMVGVAAAAVMMVIPAYLYHDQDMHDAVIIGELLSIAAIFMCLLFVVVDAGQGPSGTWTREIAGPGGIDVATAAIDAAIEANVRMSYDSFVTATRAWRDEIIRYRCALPADTVASLKRERANWRCDDVTFEVARIAFDDLAPERARRLHAIPTRLKLPAGDIDELIAAGRDALLTNPTVTGYQWRVVNAASR